MAEILIFSLEIGINLHSQTNVLPQTLQREHMALLGRKDLARSIIKTLIANRNEHRFRLFFTKATERVRKCDEIAEPKFPGRSGSERDFFIPAIQSTKQAVLQ